MNVQYLFSQNVAVIGIIWSNMKCNSNYSHFFNTSENGEFCHQNEISDMVFIKEQTITYLLIFKLKDNFFRVKGQDSREGKE